ncbi:MAG: hypothetical protein CM15mP12_3830 [Gammaproteobacteria bacterium]|nr:MAG: hypothetical protein CM15mP12_3830 [Gammaproteobacteria bacterium]
MPFYMPIKSVGVVGDNRIYADGGLEISKYNQT